MNHCCIGGVTYARFNVIICADISVKINENGKLKKSMSTQEYNSGSVNNFFEFKILLKKETGYTMPNVTSN